MATKKQPSGTKKRTSSAKQATKKSAPRPLTWKFYAVTIGIFVVAVGSVVVIALLTSYIAATQLQKERLSRIHHVYASIEAGDTYTPISTDIFGDKRTYQWDKHRTHSSEVTYIHGDTVSNTVADLDAKIKTAGFQFIDEPYPYSTTKQYHYKSAAGVYVRLSVSSKPYDDAVQNATIMGRELPTSVFEMDRNAGPSRVVLKVNLDDNNE